MTIPNSMLLSLTTTLLVSVNILAADLTIPNSFTASTPAVAAEVNANFSAVKVEVDDNNLRINNNADNIAANAAAMASALKFAGDGSAGDKIVLLSEDWNLTPPNNPNFANFTIQTGQTLTVTAGTTIRCSGNFINNGTIEVSTGVSTQATSGISISNGPSQGIAGIAHPGDSFAAASSAQYHNDIIVNPKVVFGGQGGNKIPKSTFITSFNSLRFGGGSGGGWTSGGGGGGLLKIYCQGTITNNGIINANGGAGGVQTGGGGGGIVIFASMASVTNSSGTINARGGEGGSFPFGGSPGGGGGGIVGLIAPIVTTTGGTIDVVGGTAQTATGSVGGSNANGGGGGGASGGDGGGGGSVTSTGIKNSGSNGIEGYALEVLVNPASLMF